MTSQLQRNIIATLTYYNVIDYPMTAFEIWKYLTRFGTDDLEGEEFSLADVFRELEKDDLGKFIEECKGFYFIKGRKKLVDQRISRNKIAEKKFNTLLRIVKILRFAPFVKMIAVTGRLAMKNSEKSSDLDVLIVIKEGKIFAGRTMVTLISHLMGKRRYGRKIASRLCLNYFVSENSLEINLKDLFSSSEYFFMFPVFGFDVFEKFQASNLWIKKYKPNFSQDAIPNLKMVEDNFFSKRIRRAGEFVLNFDFIENWLKKWQTARIMRDPRTHRLGSIVIANSDMLIFLPDPQSPKIFEKFKKDFDYYNTSIQSSEISLY